MNVRKLKKPLFIAPFFVFCFKYWNEKLFEEKRGTTIN
tara:strand:+ start:12359 stop:12472 length:114 start_codon:yes stop_codon:yes gene_type:complete